MSRAKPPPAWSGTWSTRCCTASCSTTSLSSPPYRATTAPPYRRWIKPLQHLADCEEHALMVRWCRTGLRAAADAGERAHDRRVGPFVAAEIHATGERLLERAWLSLAQLGPSLPGTKAEGAGCEAEFARLDGRSDPKHGRLSRCRGMRSLGPMRRSTLAGGRQKLCLQPERQGLQPPCSGKPITGQSTWVNDRCATRSSASPGAHESICSFQAPSRRTPVSDTRAQNTASPLASRGASARHGGSDQSTDRPRPFHQREDRQRPRLEYHEQAWCRQSITGSRDRPSSAPGGAECLNPM
jgi:hypothetical protein